jgi:hypothetical protein
MTKALQRALTASGRKSDPLQPTTAFAACSVGRELKGPSARAFSDTSLMLGQAHGGREPFEARDR